MGVDLESGSVHVNSEDWLNGKAKGARRLHKAQREPAATGEDVRDPQITSDLSFYAWHSPT
jgi:hypothetical protein